MALYKREKVNPMSGCLPVLVQIPIFFALYKVILTSIELRHAPFFGWIHDLSAPDPTSLFNLFGLIPWTPPHMLMIGIWPIIMGITMWLQMRLNPTPPDPVQASLFNWMPVIVHLHAGHLPGGPGHLLGLEQHAVDPAADLHHETAWHRGGFPRQHPRRACPSSRRSSPVDPGLHTGPDRCGPPTFRRPVDFRAGRGQAGAIAARSAASRSPSPGGRTSASHRSSMRSRASTDWRAPPTRRGGRASSTSSM